VGIIFLVGQVLDAVVTPIFGSISDMIESPFGKRKPFYLLGCILNTVGGLLMFDSLGGCWICIEGDPNVDQQKFLFQIFAFTIYNVGWAAVQVAHLSVVPSSSAD